MKLTKSRRDLVDLASIDSVVDSYARWRRASRAVAAADRNWRSDRRSDRSVAFHRYVEALDWEEEAARIYRRALEQTQTG